MSADNEEQKTGIPSNHELATRVQRIESQVDRVADGVDRIEDNLEENQQEIRKQVEDHEFKINRLWLIYTFLRWAVPLAIGSGASYIVLI